MKDCLMDGLIDTLKLLPYLLITFIVLEFIEHKLSKKNQNVLSKNSLINFPNPPFHPTLLMYNRSNSSVKNLF